MKSIKSILIPLAFSTLAGHTCTLSAFGQVVEVEPNDSKAAATLAPAIGGLASGATITGTTTGTSTTVAGITSADYFRVKTAAAAPGIYRNRLILSSTTAGHTGTIRGLNQTGSAAVGGTAGTTDTSVQTSSATTTPARFNQWYGFGASEEVFYRVTGGAATSAAYTATLETTPVAPIVVSTPLTAGAVTIAPATGNTSDTDYWLYDANFAPIPGAARDDGTPLGTVTVNLTPGTYYLAISDYNFTNNLPSPAGDSWFLAPVLDFPNLVASSSTTTGVNLNVKFTSPSGTFDTTGVTKTGAFDVLFLQLTVVPNEALTGNGAAVPAAALNNGSSAIQFTVTVSPGLNPASTGIAVALDLSSLGGSNAAAALDNGLSGDGAANDNVFGLSYTIPNGATTGTFNVPFIVSDAQARTFNGSIAGIQVFAPPAIAADLGDLAQPTLASQSVDLAAAEVKWFRFSLSQPVNSGAGTFLDFDTEGSIVDAAVTFTDTEIAVYNAGGQLVATDDDDGDGLHSLLTFGAGTRPLVGAGTAYDGRDGALPAGTYYIALTRFNATFGTSGFSVVGAGTGVDTATRLNYRSSNPTNPAGTGIAAPASVSNNGSGITSLQVTVAPGNFPVSTGLGVTVNASAIGAGTVTLLDDGLNGDGAANDNVFARSVTVANATPAGSLSLPFSITDAQTRTGAGTIALTITGTNPADFNNDGNVTVQDIFDFLAAYFANLPSADFNGVGGLTVQDIFDFLSAYFGA